MTRNYFLSFLAAAQLSGAFLFLRPLFMSVMSGNCYSDMPCMKRPYRDKNVTKCLSPLVSSQEKIVLVLLINSG